ncbi:MAG: nucleotidyltransferase family protein [Bacillota bacterium]
MAEGIVLAGGYSSRMNANKMALIYHGKPLILSTIEAMKPHVSRMVVVSGHHHGSLRLLLKGLPEVSVVKNPDYSEGMFSSIKVGMAHTEEDVFIIPGDCPLVNPTTYERLKEGKGSIRVPAYEKRRGHPIYLSKTLREDLLNAPSTMNLKAFRDQKGFETIPVEDPGILIDIDTKEDYDTITKDQ